MSNVTSIYWNNFCVLEKFLGEKKFLSNEVVKEAVKEYFTGLDEPEFPDDIMTLERR
ncbi:hypothetical protein WH47_02351 [Habropoda laboriosa]|uniref:Histone-lysine N-methyltransferase SETMAR n=1 Tax=Habropoda laboriosa TaxID=597456 RepID=A0A0L7QZI6_9HYME|nr:hypothetical protein WH47_02351 [Habropoda laboriosa]